MSIGEVEGRWWRSRSAPDESRRSSENSRRGARARGPASCGGVEQAASWSGRTALRRSSDVAEVVNGPPRASTKRAKDPFTLLSASPARPVQPGRSEGRTIEGNRASRSPSCSSRPAAQRLAHCNTRVKQETPGVTTRRPSSRHKGLSGNLPAPCEPLVIQAPSWNEGSRAHFFSWVLYESL